MSGGSCLVVTVVADGLPLAAGLCSAQADDGVGAADGPVHAGLLEPLADDSLNNQPGLEGSDVVAGQGCFTETAGRLRLTLESVTKEKLCSLFGIGYPLPI